MITLGQAIGAAEQAREIERAEALRVLLAQAKQAAQVVEGLRAGIRNVRSPHRHAAMSVAVDLATEMLARFVAGAENEAGVADFPDVEAASNLPARDQLSIIARVSPTAAAVLSKRDRAQAEEAGRRA